MLALAPRSKQPTSLGYRHVGLKTAAVPQGLGICAYTPEQRQRFEHSRTRAAALQPPGQHVSDAEMLKSAISYLTGEPPLLQLNGRASGSTDFSKITVAGFQRASDLKGAAAQALTNWHEQWIASSVSRSKYPAIRIVPVPGNMFDFNTTDFLIRSDDSDITTAEDMASIVASFAMSPGGIPCLDVPASLQAQKAVFTPGNPKIKHSASAFEGGHRIHLVAQLHHCTDPVLTAQMQQSPHEAVAAFISDWTRSVWIKAQAEARTAKGGDRLTVEEVEDTYNSTDMDLPRALEFAAIKRSGKTELAFIFRHASIVTYFKEIDGLELMHPENGVMRLVFPQVELKRNLLRLGLDRSVVTLLEPGAAAALMADVERYAMAWHETYVGPLPQYKQAAAREESARAEAEAAAFAMNMSPAGKRVVVDAAAAAAANPYRPTLLYSGMFNAEGIPITAISREAQTQIREAFVGCSDPISYICAYGGATVGMPATVITVQPHAGGRIRNGVQIQAKPTMLTKMSENAVQRRYYEISHCIFISSNTLMADSTGMACCQLAALTGEVAIDTAAVLRGAVSLCRAPPEPEPAAAADEPEGTFNPALAMESLFANLENIQAAEAAAKAREAAIPAAATATELAATALNSGAVTGAAGSNRAAGRGWGSSSGGSDGRSRGGPRGGGRSGSNTRGRGGRGGGLPATAAAGNRGNTQDGGSSKQAAARAPGAPSGSLGQAAAVGEAAEHHLRGRERDRSDREIEAAAQGARGSGMEIDQQDPAGDAAAAGGGAL